MCRFYGATNDIVRRGLLKIENIGGIVFRNLRLNGWTVKWEHQIMQLSATIVQDESKRKYSYGSVFYTDVQTLPPTNVFDGVARMRRPIPSKRGSVDQWDGNNDDTGNQWESKTLTTSILIVTMSHGIKASTFSWFFTSSRDVAWCGAWRRTSALRLVSTKSSSYRRDTRRNT